MNDIEQFAEFAAQLAAVSAKIIKSYFRLALTVDDKADGSPVTAADREAEEAMRSLITCTFPAHGILGEEFGEHQADAAYRWTLDPIDGTKNFVAGSFLFGTLIGLLRDNRPVLGLIHHPLTGDLLVGTGAATRLNGQPVCVRPCTRIEDALMLNTTHWGVESDGRNMAAYEALTRRVRRYRTWGDCHGYYLVATGGADIMLDSSMNLWDLAPLIPIIEGAGGIITDWHGGAALGGVGAVATGGGIHDMVIQALNPAGC